MCISPISNSIHETSGFLRRFVEGQPLVHCLFPERLVSPSQQPYPLACFPALKKDCTSALSPSGSLIIQFNQLIIPLHSGVFVADLLFDAFRAFLDFGYWCCATFLFHQPSRRSSARLDLEGTSKVRADCRPLAKYASCKAFKRSQSSRSRPTSPPLSYETSTKFLGAVVLA